jgi:UDP-glucose 4-epimerase
MRVLVTGGAGYIGAVVARELERAGHRLWILDNFSTGRREVSGILQGSLVEWVDADLDDTLALEGLLAKVGFDACIHLAGSTRVDESMAQPGLYYRNNLSCGIKLLDRLTRFAVRNLVFSSTAAVYGIPARTPIEENHPTIPTNPYGETKLAFERMLRWYRGAGGPGFIALRYFNAAGAASDGTLGESHDPESHLIPNLLSCAAAGKPAALFGQDYPTQDGTCVRDYVHVEDLAKAHRLAMELLERGPLAEAINLGSGRGYSVREVVQAVRRITGKALEVEVHPRREGDPPVLVASWQKASQLLGWEPQRSDLETIVTTAWAWHLQRHVLPGSGGTA